MNESKVKIFLSHHHEDSEAVLKFKIKLEELSAGKLKCFQSSAPGTIKAGEDWHKRIRVELGKSDALFLLFTDPSQSWDWCLYEVGLFTDLAKKEEQSKIICLCSYEDEPPPSPLGSRQFVRATKEDLKQFLTDLFKKPKFFSRRGAINAELKDDTIEELATQLANVLSKHSMEPQYFTDWMKLHIPEPNELKVDSIPPNARLVPYKDCLELFGMAEKPPNKSFWTWEDLINNGKHIGCFSDAEAWEESIAKMLYAAKEGHTLEQKAELFKSGNSDDSLRPILTKFEVDSNGTMVFHLILVTQTDKSPRKQN
jgi:hypothetical protein